MAARLMKKFSALYGNPRRVTVILAKPTSKYLSSDICYQTLQSADMQTVKWHVNWHFRELLTTDMTRWNWRRVELGYVIYIYIYRTGELVSDTGPILSKVNQVRTNPSYSFSAAFPPKFVYFTQVWSKLQIVKNLMSSRQWHWRIWQYRF